MNTVVRTPAAPQSLPSPRPRTREAVDVEKWVSGFKARHGRPPRVLHVGNVANNAYVNAKLLNEAGFDCDVLVYDYFHVMSSPEWEEVSITGDVGDSYRPDWTGVELGRFRRPKWFAQGRVTTALDYLIAKRSGRTRRAGRLWSRMALENCTRRRNLRDRAGVLAAPLLGLLRRLSSRRAPSRSLHCAVHRAAVWLNRRCQRHDEQTLRGRWFRWLRWAGRRALATSRPLRRELARMTNSAHGRSVGRLCDRVCTWLAEPPEVIEDPADVTRRLAAVFEEQFPDRSDTVELDDVASYVGLLPRWSRLMSHYDAIVGYAVDGLWPFLCGKRPYIAYEHGTIRDLPFQLDGSGRRASLAYRNADAVYVTNFDSLRQADRLAASPDALVYGLHGFDERRIERVLAETAACPRSEGRFRIPDELAVFFAPARQHWKNGLPTWRKGNDLAIRAVRELLDRGLADFRLVCVEWGAEVDLSRELVERLDVADHVVWVPPVEKRFLTHVYRSVEAVVDQFVLPALGGVTMEALWVGQGPVITRVDEEAAVEFFGEPIPLLNCATAEEIADAMETVVLEPEAGRRIARAGRAWMERHHSGRRVVETHVSALRTAGVR